MIMEDDKIKKILFSDTLDTIADWIYPKRCPICDKVVLYGTAICPECYSEITIIKEKYCVVCGKPLRRGQTEYCTDCEVNRHVYHSGRALCVYHGKVKESIYRIKYANRQEYCDFYAREIKKQLGNYIKSLDADALIPVPISAAKLKKRGYNQAECIAAALSKYTHIPVINNLVVRVRDTAPQKQLDVAERQNNLKKAFKIGQNDVKLNTTIIIDDIYTTGSTIDAIAAVLKEAGVKRIYFVTLAIGKQ